MHPQTNLGLENLVHSHTHVFTTSIYCGLNVENSPNLSMRVTTCDQLFLISPYYITMKVPVSITKTGGF